MNESPNPNCPNLTSPKPTDSPAETLLNHMRAAALRDLNPFNRGRPNQLISLLAPYFPDYDRLLSLSLNWSDNGWLTADSLRQIAELSEKFGPGLTFIQSPGRQALLPALDPNREEELWDSLPRSGPRRLTPKTEAGPGRCPLWGPCLGQRTRHSDLLWELAEELAKEIDDAFRVELTGCPQDCRLALERSDTGLVLAEDGRGLTVWLGGRHRFGRSPIQPTPLAFFDLTEAWPAMDLIFLFHDLWYTHRLPADETFPEMVKRLDHKFYQLAKMTPKDPGPLALQGPSIEDPSLEGPSSEGQPL